MKNLTFLLLCFLAICGGHLRGDTTGSQSPALRDCSEINSRFFEEKSCSDFDDFFAAGSAEPACKKKSSIDEQNFPTRNVKVISEQSLTLYYAPYCPFSREVLAYLNSIQKKIPMKNVKQDPTAKEELKRLGGVLEVPCLMIGDQALYSSEAIIEWLKEHEDELEPMYTETT